MFIEKPKHSIIFIFLIAFSICSVLTSDARSQPLSSTAQAEANIQNLWIPALMRMTQQFTATIMNQAAIVGTFFDAKHQLETQRLFDEMYVDTIMRYQPSEALCRFGTLNRGLASSEQKAKSNSVAFAKKLMERDISRADTAVGAIRAEGRKGVKGADLEVRYNEFRNLYCRQEHFGGDVGIIQIAGEPLCKDGANLKVMNMNYTKLANDELTLDINFMDEQATEDEMAVMALAKNLFSNEVFSARTALDWSMSDNMEHLTYLRSMWAAKSVARNSFVNMIGRRSAGSGAADDFMVPMLMELGLSEENSLKVIGAAKLGESGTENPANLSYEAQMEILSKTLYQNPNFFVGLIDTPVNVQRQRAAIKSVRLMLERDIFEALQRREILLATIMNEMLYPTFQRLE